MDAAPGDIRLRSFRIQLERVRPDEIAAADGGWTIEAGFADSPFGHFAAAFTPRGLCYAGFQDSRDTGGMESDLRRAFPSIRFRRNDAETAALADQLFGSASGGEKSAPVPVLLSGTPFQLEVWTTLATIPSGTVMTYAELAAACGRLRAVRATAGAVGANRVAYLIPCHRVIHSSGEVGGYRWSVERKRMLLSAEAL